MEKLDCRTLMIGDWVYLCTPNKMIPCQITALDETTIWQEYYKEIFKSKNYKPIPLTAEILEKNGFKCTEVYEKYEWIERHNAIWVIMGDSNDGLKLNVIHIDGWQRRIPLCYHNIIFYVHQLQHALRLCGIEKEIVI